MKWTTGGVAMLQADEGEEEGRGRLSKNAAFRMRESGTDDQSLLNHQPEGKERGVVRKTRRSSREAGRDDHPPSTPTRG